MREEVCDCCQGKPRMRQVVHQQRKNGDFLDNRIHNPSRHWRQRRVKNAPISCSKAVY
jgi:hypothetical protein